MKRNFNDINKKENQAAVPMNLFFSNPMDRKYIDIIGPAALPTIVMNPPKKPIMIERPLFCFTSILIIVIKAPAIINPNKT